MEFEFKDYYRNIPDSELIEDVIVVSKKIGKNTLTMSDYSLYGKYHSLTMQKRFKSWFVVLEKAGLQPHRARPADTKNLNEELLFNNLADVWMKLGRQPKIKDMKHPLARYSYKIYARYFGTWMNALRKFMEYQNAGKLNGDKLGAKPMVQEQASGMAEEPLLKEYVRKEGNTREIPLRLKFAVLLRDGFRCRACGKSPLTHSGVVLHCDHIDPWSNGGRTILINLQTLCEECNFGKGDMCQVIAGP